MIGVSGVDFGRTAKSRGFESGGFLKRRNMRFALGGAFGEEGSDKCRVS